jgi:hypothetical protein
MKLNMSSMLVVTSYLPYTNTINKSKTVWIVAVTERALGVNADKTKSIFMSHRQNAAQNRT